jgi:hypothetical protein
MSMRIAAAFLRIADAFRDERISRLAHAAMPVPHGGGAAGAIRFFGAHFEAVHALIAPTIASIDEMAPGFAAWLRSTGYGDDRHMIIALLAITNRLEKMPKPSRRDMRAVAMASFPARLRA